MKVSVFVAFTAIALLGWLRIATYVNPDPYLLSPGVDWKGEFKGESPASIGVQAMEEDLGPCDCCSSAPCDCEDADSIPSMDGEISGGTPFDGSVTYNGLSGSSWVAETSDGGTDIICQQIPGESGNEYVCHITIYTDGVDLCEYECHIPCSEFDLVNKTATFDNFVVSPDVPEECSTPIEDPSNIVVVVTWD